MDKRFQVFVSSTYKDLVDERREVIQALLELDCIPAGMEMFPAADESQWDLIKGVIDDCDYYVVIVGGRYGSVTDEGISYTEMEYDYALQTGKPVLGFVHSNPDAIPSGNTDKDDELAKKLDAFRTKVQGKPVKFFDSPDKLGSVVSRSLTATIKKQPGEGWVKGRFAMTAEVTAEMSELRARLAEGELSRKTPQLEPPPDAAAYMQGTDPLYIGYFWRVYGNTGDLVIFPTTWDKLIAKLGPALLDEADEIALMTRLREWIAVNSTKPDAGTTTPVVVLARESWDKVKLQLLRLGVIQRGTKRRGVNDTSTYWTLTPWGEFYVANLVADRRAETDPVE